MAFLNEWDWKRLDGKEYLKALSITPAMPGKGHLCTIMECPAAADEH